MPVDNAKEAAIVKGIEVYPIDCLQQIIQFLNGEKKIKQFEQTERDSLLNSQYLTDFSEVKGQENAKRGMEIAAARRPQLAYDRKPRLSVKQCLQEDYQAYYQH